MQHGRQQNACIPLFLILLLPISTAIQASNTSTIPVQIQPPLETPRRSNPATFFEVDGLRSSTSTGAVKSKDVLEAELEDELRREFVRAICIAIIEEYKDGPAVEVVLAKEELAFCLGLASQFPAALYKFSMPFAIHSSLPRQFECFSCMSLIYQDNWQFLQLMYTAPKVFTNRCNEPLVQKNIPTVLCGSVCVTLLEPNVEAGVFLGYKYIRGCEDRILRHGFNQSALKTHRFIQVDQQCRHLPRASLFNQPRHVQMSVFGDVQLCTCYGDKCNGASAAPSSTQLRSLTVCSVVMLGWILWLASSHMFFFPLIAEIGGVSQHLAVFR